MFPPEQLYGVVDFETYSEADLKRVGAFEYANHPSTEILCASFRIGTRETLKTTPIRWWAPDLDGDEGSFSDFLSMLLDPEIILVAHNSFFEQVITRYVFARKYMASYAERLAKAVRPNRWVCTASLARALALPGKLEHAAAALKLPVQKDMEGHRLMLQLSKPRKPTKNNPSIRHRDQDKLKRVIDYCCTDTETETLLFLKVPPLSAKERQIWLLDQNINHCGPLVDRPLVETVIGMIGEEKAEIDRRTEELTLGAVQSCNQVAEVLSFLESEGCYLPNLQAQTVEDALRDGLAEGAAREILELRQAGGKSSTAKYFALEQRSRTDGRLRDILVYHGPSTGRWAGAGAQLQNLPRGTIADTIGACEVLRDGDLETVRMLYEKPMEVFASCCRSMLIAPEGYTLDVGDYSAIEARVLFWLAGHTAGIKAFTEGRDLYKELATVIYQVPLDKVTKDQRFVGKTATLGCGYGMGPKKFITACYAQSKGKAVVDEETAKRAVYAYRNTHRPITELWSNLERAAVAAVQNPGTAYTINKTTWVMRAGFLWCRLPSGRRLSYPYPSIRYEPNKWGDKKPVLYVWGVNARTKKWTNEKTWGGTLVENAVQAISRDVMADAMLRIDATGIWRIVLTVHDEVAGERKLNGKGSHEEFLNLLRAVPDWAAGAPIAVEGFESTRYRK